MIQIKLREWDRLEYHDSRKVLVKLAKLGNIVAKSNLPTDIKTLRTKSQRKFLEGRQAALCCYGIGKTVLKTKVYHALVEKSDYDSVALWGKDDTMNFAPIQLKEVVPKSRNPKTSINEELKKLSKYSNSEDLIIAVHVNRAGRIKISDIRVPKLNVAELWLYGGLTSDQSRWFLIGNLLNDINFYEFSYPIDD